MSKRTFYINIYMEELEPMLRSVTVQCPICGWNISENMV